jgi:mannose-6-phosphate isomerase-like protein (cupin superfamily)
MTEHSPHIVSITRPLRQYSWGPGANCQAWNLVEEEGFSIKIERMPSGTRETLHFHEKARQFFFILRGSAVFQWESEWFNLEAGQGIQVQGGIKHRIMNEGTEELEFLLASQPSIGMDRVNG